MTHTDLKDQRNREALNFDCFLPIIELSCMYLADYCFEMAGSLGSYTFYSKNREYAALLDTELFGTT